jgi:hypothetical protein
MVLGGRKEGDQEEKQPLEKWAHRENSLLITKCETKSFKRHLGIHFRVKFAGLSRQWQLRHLLQIIAWNKTPTKKYIV